MIDTLVSHFWMPSGSALYEMHVSTAANITQVNLWKESRSAEFDTFTPARLRWSQPIALLPMQSGTPRKFAQRAESAEVATFSSL